MSKLMIALVCLIGTPTWAADYHRVAWCESNSVRLERVSEPHYSDHIQFVINHRGAIAALERAGATNRSNMVGDGELLLTNLEFESWSGAYYAYSPRDYGTLVYRIHLIPNFSQYNNQSMLDLEVGWTNGDISGMKRNFRPFANYRFYGCAF